MDAAPATEEFNALKEALAQALQRSDALAGELRMVRAERDLLRERLNQSLLLYGSNFSSMPPAALLISFINFRLLRKVSYE